MTLHKFGGNEDLIAHQAFLVIQKDFYSSSGGNIPDFLPFKKPEVFDINQKNYPDPVLTMIVSAVRSVCLEIVQKQYPGQHILGMNCPSHELERISWKVFALLRLAPLRTVDSEGKTILRHDPFRLEDDYGEEDHLDMTHNRVEKVNREWAEIRHTKLNSALLDILTKRYKFLEELFETDNQTEQEYIMARIESCFQEIGPIKRDIHALCSQYGIINHLLKIDEEESSFSGAIHWNYYQKQEKAREEFVLSETESSLLPLAPKNFQQEEWPLFHFTFVPVEEIEEYSMDFDGVLREDIRLLRERSLARKMLIGYFTLRQIALSHRKPAHLTSPSLSFFEKKLEPLRQEIDLLKRRLFNKTGQANRVKNTLSEIDTLMVSMQNLLQAPRMSPFLSRIMESVMGIMHAFYSHCNALYEDELTDLLQLEGQVDRLRLEALKQLRVCESEIITLETTSSLSDHPHFDRVVSVMNQAVSFLEGEK